jgi:hypothetical protein
VGWWHKPQCLNRLWRATKEKAEMTRLIRSFAGLAALLTAVAANAQYPHEARVTVPFSFMVEGRSSPPGNYLVDIDREREVVTLICRAAKPIMFITSNAWQPQNGRTYLRFHRYGERWFLERVAINGVAQDVPIAKRVKEVFTASTVGNGGPILADIAAH